jgi:cytochrome c nitrite reductase small subunit
VIAREKILLLFVLGVAPVLITLATFALSFRRAQQVQFCANCHTMTPWVDDLHNPKSDSLAAKHYRNRWVLKDQCYTCHVDYGFFGPIKTKLVSLKHVVVYYGGLVPEKVQMYKPFPNGNCLQCHGAAEKFKSNPAHVAAMEPILSNNISCVTCHQPIHAVER